MDIATTTLSDSQSDADHTQSARGFATSLARTHAEKLTAAIADPNHPDARIFAYGPKIEAATAALREFQASLNAAERAYIEERALLEEPTKPEYLREIHDGMTLAEIRDAPHPNQAEWDAYHAALSAFRSRCDELHKKYNVERNERRFGRAVDAQYAPMKAAIRLRATTFEGLLFKAKLMDQLQDDHLAGELVKDLLAMLKRSSQRRTTH